VTATPMTMRQVGETAFWEYVVIRHGAPWFFAISGIPFVASR
jgi:hypothetical protein